MNNLTTDPSPKGEGRIKPIAYTAAIAALIFIAYKIWNEEGYTPVTEYGRKQYTPEEDESWRSFL